MVQKGGEQDNAKVRFIPLLSNLSRKASCPCSSSSVGKGKTKLSMVKVGILGMMT